MNPENRVIINAAITGMIPTQKDSPYVPITIKEILNCVRQVRDAGASIVHLHARNIDQTPAYESAFGLTAYVPAVHIQTIQIN